MHIDNRGLCDTIGSGICTSSSTASSGSSCNSSRDGGERGISSNVLYPFVVKRYIVHTMNGDYLGIQVVMDVFKVATASLMVMGLIFMKFCAGCSLLFQPNDLQICFMSIRRYLASQKYESDKEKNLPPPPWIPLILT